MDFSDQAKSGSNGINDAHASSTEKQNEEASSAKSSELDKQDTRVGTSDVKGIKKPSKTRQYLTYKDLEDLNEQIVAAPELPLHERNVESRPEVLEYLKKSIILMNKRGYSADAITEFINKNQGAYVFKRKEINKILAEKAPADTGTKATGKKRGRKPKQAANELDG